MRINAKQFLAGFKARRLSPMLKRIKDPLAFANRDKVAQAIQRGREGMADQFNKKTNFQGKRWKPTEHKRPGWRSTLIVTGDLKRAWTGESPDWRMEITPRRIEYEPTITTKKGDPYWAYHQHGSPSTNLVSRPVSISTEGIKDRLRKIVHSMWADSWGGK